MVYTPPQMSDHIGVSAVLPLHVEAPTTDWTSCDLCTAKTTRRAQPHLAQATIMQSFAAQRKRPPTPTETDTMRSEKDARVDDPVVAPARTVAADHVDTSAVVTSVTSASALCDHCHFRVCKCSSKAAAKKKKKQPQGKVLVRTLTFGAACAFTFGAACALICLEMV
jgi:hypothetical protein